MRSSTLIMFICTIWVKISKDDPFVLKGGIEYGSVWFCTVWPPQKSQLHMTSKYFRVHHNWCVGVSILEKLQKEFSCDV